MRNTTYRYNPHTCQYERVRLNARSVLWYLAGVLAAASCLLTGLLLFHDFVVDTHQEKKLRLENRALRRHHAVLSDQLNDLQPVLISLQNKDRILHARIFGTSATPIVADSDGVQKERVLLADAGTFRELVSALNAETENLIGVSVSSNDHFGRVVTLSRDNLELANAMPTLQPVIPWDSERIISGFGPRVNPFHKGLYDHLGVDIALPRGTAVVATGPGVVTQLKRSDLEAGYGNYIEIDHGHGVVTRYAHLEDITVRYGAKVSKAEVVGTIGTSGGSVAPHLHYEVIRNGRNIDPIMYMIEGLTSEEHHRLSVLSHRQNQSLD